MYHQSARQQNMQTSAEGFRKASQVPASTPLGLWMLEVQKLVGQLFSGGASAPQYMNAKNQAAQVIAASATNVKFDTVIASRGITILGGDEVFQLTQGKTYLLSARGRATGFATAATGRIQVRWVDENDANLPTSGPDAVPGEWIPPTNTTADSDDPVADLIYVVPSTVAGSRVKLRVTDAAGLAATIPSNGVQAYIVEIPG